MERRSPGDTCFGDTCFGSLVVFSEWSLFDFGLWLSTVVGLWISALGACYFLLDFEW